MRTASIHGPAAGIRIRVLNDLGYATTVFIMVALPAFCIAVFFERFFPSPWFHIAAHVAQWAVVIAAAAFLILFVCDWLLVRKNPSHVR